MKTHSRRQRVARALGAAWLAVLSLTQIVACGGSDSAAPPPATTTTIGSVGGTAIGPSGAQVVIPPSALAQPTVIGIAQDGSGAPAVAAGNIPVGAIYALIPHGIAFAAPVTVTVPFDAAQVPAGATPLLLKTNAARTGWDPVAGATINGTTMQGQISGFSWIVVVIPPSTPTITAQPADQSVVAPTAATFAVGATGLTSAGPLSYQWKRNGVPIPGATAPSYTTPPTDVAADNGATFIVDVTNGAGTTTSRAALLTVTAVVTAPAIATQPANASVAAGITAQFSVVATGTSLSYQWQRSNDGGATWSNVTSGSGATTASYTTAATAAADNNARFRVVISNAAGSVTSNPATLTVTTLSNAAAPQYLAAGDQFSLAVQTSGTILAWGNNSIGSLGDGTNLPRSAPVTVLGINDAMAVSASSHALVLRATDGSVWAWGYGGLGQLGDQPGPCGGTCESRNAPVRAGTLTGMVGVAAGGLHSLAAKSDGTVWAWGNNDHGQLGDGTTLERPRPIQVPGLSNVRTVAAGNQFSLALKNDGTVWAWGANDHGQIGDNTIIERHTPVQVLLPSGALSIAAGDSHALAVLGSAPATSGTPYVWGNNASGQLGLGTTTDARLPTPLSGMIKQTAGGGAHSLLLYFDTALFAMGRNVEGQIGDASNTERHSPTFVANIACDFVAAGSQHSLCVKANTKEVWAWGWNFGGQLGDGTKTDRNAPVRAIGVLVK